MSETRREARQRRSSKSRGFIAGIVIGSLALVGVGGFAAWSTFETPIRHLFGLGPADFAGEGTEPTVLVTIKEGDYGDAVASKLVKAGVTKSFDAVYELLLKDSSIVFTPGTYELNTGMSAQSALDVISDAKNRLVWKVTIPEGLIIDNVVARLVKATGIAKADFDEVITDTASFRLPEGVTTIEGYLFPATYEFEYGSTAREIIATMVTTMDGHLNDLGVLDADKHAILTMASVVQREAGSNPIDFGKVARVFYNRLDDGWKLQSDATVTYGTGNFDSVWTTDAERADASNLYNTYVHPGLPIGPIGAPGLVALEAAVRPPQGPWFYFVPVNLKTGETQFSVTADEHAAGVRKLKAWCEASDENASYCG
ncbi:MAG: endolytic transglycosylase MltG [Microbacteriaceae bacterium]